MNTNPTEITQAITNIINTNYQTSQDAESAKDALFAEYDINAILTEQFSQNNQLFIDLLVQFFFKYQLFIDPTLPDMLEWKAQKYEGKFSISEKIAHAIILMTPSGESERREMMKNLQPTINTLFDKISSTKNRFHAECYKDLLAFLIFRLFKLQLDQTPDREYNYLGNYFLNTLMQFVNTLYGSEYDKMISGILQQYPDLQTNFKRYLTENNISYDNVSKEERIKQFMTFQIHNLQARELLFEAARDMITEYIDAAEVSTLNIFYPAYKTPDFPVIARNLINLDTDKKGEEERITLYRNLQEETKKVGPINLSEIEKYTSTLEQKSKPQPTTSQAQFEETKFEETKSNDVTIPEKINQGYTPLPDASMRAKSKAQNLRRQTLTPQKTRPKGSIDRESSQDSGIKRDFKINSRGSSLSSNGSTDIISRKPDGTKTIRNRSNEGGYFKRSTSVISSDGETKTFGGDRYYDQKQLNKKVQSSRSSSQNPQNTVSILNTSGDKTTLNALGKKPRSNSRESSITLPSLANNKQTNQPSSNFSNLESANSSEQPMSTKPKPNQTKRGMGGK